MKKKLILTSILSIVMCFSLICGATFALFTSEDKVNIAITSGTVNVTANIDENSVKTKQLYDTDYTQGKDNMFEGEATFNEQGLTLNKLVPGDGIMFNIVVKNNSNVKIQYRTIILCENDTGLFSGLEMSINNEKYNGVSYVADWTLLDVGAGDAVIPVVIELPDDAGNDYQDKTCTISYKVEAVQGNADTENPADDTIYIYTANDLMAISGKYIVGNNGVAENTNIELMNDINLNGAEFKEIGVAYGDSLNFYGNGHTISNVKLVTGGHDGMKTVGMFFVATDSTLNVERLKLSNVVVENGYDDVGSTGVAAVVGYANGNSAVNLTDVDVEKANVNNAYGNAAIYVGYATSTINMTDCDVKDSTASGEIENDEVRKDKTGAFFGTANSAYVYTMNNCTNDTELPIAGRVINGATLTIDGWNYVTTADAFSKLMQGSASEVNIILGDGKYVNLLTASNKTINIVGENENGAEIALTTAVNPSSHDHLGLGGCTVTLENIKATFEDGTYYGAYINNPTMTYKNCTIIGQQHIYGNVSFIGCTFDNDDEVAKTVGRYTYIYSGDVLVDNCDFFTQGHGLIMYSDYGGGGNRTLTVKNSRFHGGQGRTAGAVINQNTAAIEIDGSCGANYTLKLEGTNTFDQGFSGLWRIKAMKDSVTTTIDGIAYTGTASDVYLDGVKYFKASNLYIYDVDTIFYDANVNGGLYTYLPTLNSGDVLVLPEGTYETSGTFTIPAGVTIKGELGKTVVIRQNSAAQDNIFNCAGDVVIENISFESNRKGYAIADNTKDHDTDGDITVINCHFKGLATEKNWGIYKNLNGDLTIIDCTFDNYNNAICGVKNENGSKTVITGCTFTNINSEAIGYVASLMPADFEATVIANNTGLTAENVIGY